MPLSLVLAAALWIEPITRDRYGVPTIRANSAEQAWFFSGYACAQDRLWQMENSRRLSQSQLAEVYGESMVKSDRDRAKTGYTPEEFDEQFAALPADLQLALRAYARGVNFWIMEASRTGRLPEGYAKFGFEPRKWTPRDSIAIAVSLFQRFGTGADGELRNLAGLAYFRSQKKLGDRWIDVMDDFLWADRPDAPTTVSAADDGRKSPFALATRAQSLKQIEALPKIPLGDLIGAMGLARMDEQIKVAEVVAAPSKWGSYAMLVNAKRSKTGHALLLGAPQMGFSNPSIVHETRIHAPGLQVAGVEVPGLPGVIIGCTPNFAWTFTSGIGDSNDVFYLPQEKAKLTRLEFKIKVKGQSEPVVVVQERTDKGPVLLKSQGHVFSQRRTYFMSEVQGLASLHQIYSGKSFRDFHKAFARQSTSFNAFFALKNGDIGYQYCGSIPIRAKGLDWRFPTLDVPENDWKGRFSWEQMPRVINPKNGLLTNWNNKPARWWPNFDSPVWGEIDHVQEIRDSLGDRQLTTDDLANAARYISRRESTYTSFAAYLDRCLAGDTSGVDPEYVAALRAFKGEWAFGVAGGPAYDDWFDALREAIFVPHVGTFLTPDFFDQVCQPSLALRALRKQTRYDYLAGRTEQEVLAAALKGGAAKYARRKPSAKLFDYWVLRYPGQDVIRFSNRGTTIQILELGNTIAGVNIAPPGVAESGEHQYDQARLARDFEFKPFRPDWNP
ncbi:MAG: penicillin acylase family protein [Armatimonadetes bacterium]|nr:penicillin acylase family protein [Armatimonadota bacterium]